MLFTFRYYFFIGLLFCFSSLFSLAQAQPQPAGQVLLVAGKLAAQQPNQKTRLLKRGAPFYTADTLTTSDDSEAQLRFTDGTLVAMRPDSAVKIEQYQFSNTQTAGKNKAFAYTVSLIQGGFRSISGAIAKADPDSYKIKTSVATIGVRGTEFSLAIDASGGLGAGIYTGRIYLQNNAGYIEIGKGAAFNYAYVASAYTAPKGEPVRPSLLLNDPRFGGQNQNTGTPHSDICLH